MREVLLLGPVEIRVDGARVHAGGKRQRAVLATLAVRAGRVVAADRLAEAAWGDDAVDRSRGTLQVYVSNLRRALGSPDAIVARGGGYVLDAAVEVDAIVFERGVARALAALEAGDADPAVAAFRAALDLWRGSFASDLTAVAALDADRTALHDRRLAATEAFFDAELRLGRHASITAELDAAARANPYRERLWELLMLALYRSGRQVDALRAFQEARSILAGDLGLAPSPALQRLERSILDQSSDAGLLPAVSVLAWLDADGQTRRLELAPAGVAVKVGRATDSHVALPWDAKVSRHHADIEFDDDRWLVTDRSTNGTYRNGERLDRGPTPLADGDLLRFGDTSVSVRLAGATRPRRPFVGQTVVDPR